MEHVLFTLHWLWRRLLPDIEDLRLLLREGGEGGDFNASKGDSLHGGGAGGGGA